MRPLPAVLLDLHEELATGKLLLRRGKVSKTVDLVNGNPVSTASTPRDETLGAFLVTTGVITEEQHRLGVGRATAVGGKLGEALVALQVLTVEQLIEQLGRQARHKLVQALRWPQGAWRFDPDTTPAEGMQLRMLEVVLGGLRETAVEDLSRLARLEGMTFELTTRGNRLRLELRKVFGERTIAALASGATMAEIEKVFGERAPARVAIDAMLMCDAVVAKAAAVGLGVKPPRTKTASGAPMTIDIETLDDADELYDTLFEDDPTLIPIEDPKTGVGANPLDLGNDGEVIEIDPDIDSGVVSREELQAVSAKRDKSARVHQAIAAEHQRISGADHYAVLLIDRDASAEDVEAGYQIKVAMFERMLGSGGATDRVKVEAIRAAYAAAREVLSNERKRAAYNRELAGGELVGGPPALDTELMFRNAEDMMAKLQWAQAVGQLKTAIQRSPNEADYHAALGWAMWNAGDRTGAAADAARGHLNHALSIDPDHPAAHDYKGRVDASLRTDDAAALFHLERALDLDPARKDALATVEQLLVTRGELRRLERVLKRVLFRMRGTGGPTEATVWVRLARLYLDHLDNANGVVAAVATAKKLAPSHPDVLSIAERAEQAFQQGDEPLVRTGWREALADPQSGAALVRSTEAAGHGDAALLAASTMVALGTADDTMRALYEQHRAQDVVIPPTPLSREQWALLRHKDDSVELGALFELIAPAIHALAPMTLAEGELDGSQRIADDELPRAFGWLRAQLGAVLGVPDAPIYSRPELGSQIHVVAADPPVVVAGDEALTAPERPELVFRIARALTFVWPGRAVGASRPGRVLRAVVLAVVREAAGTELGLDDALAARAAKFVAELPPDARVQARATALRLLSKGGGGLNLSLWAKALSRTADRAAMLLCGDIPAAIAGAKEMGELDKDLVEFAYSAAHVRLRNQLGLRRL